MPYKAMYQRYKDENPTKRRKLIKKMAEEKDMTVEEVVEGIMPYIIAEKPKNRFGSHVYIVGSLEDAEPYNEAEKRFKILNKRFSSLYRIKEFEPEDAEVIAVSNLRMCDTVYFLDGWADEPLAAKIREMAMKEKKIMAYQEYEV
ncbi:MAG: hypothetical protein IIV02_00620 [Peptococcaceae bacterium]|nr:hypothetical protein [Peptococcaceae bacterium]